MSLYQFYITLHFVLHIVHVHYVVRLYVFRKIAYTISVYTWSPDKLDKLNYDIITHFLKNNKIMAIL